MYVFGGELADSHRDAGLLIDGFLMIWFWLTKFRNIISPRSLWRGVLTSPFGSYVLRPSHRELCVNLLVAYWVLGLSISHCIYFLGLVGQKIWSVMILFAHINLSLDIWTKHNLNVMLYSAAWKVFPSSFEPSITEWQASLCCSFGFIHIISMFAFVYFQSHRLMWKVKLKMRKSWDTVLESLQWTQVSLNYPW